MSDWKRVVVTGMGAVTPIGIGVPKFWESAKNGVNGVGMLDRFETDSYKCKVAAQVNDFDPLEHVTKKDVKRMDRFVLFAVVAAREALKDSGLDVEQVGPEEFGCIIGSGVGGITIVEQEHKVMLEKGNRFVSPLFVPKMICNMASGQVSIDLNLQGPNHCTVTACAAATHALGEAAWIIRRGDAKAMVAGGSETTITPLSVAGFDNMKALTSNPDPETACRPFDKERDGFIMGEGAGILVLEELEHAKARGATIYAELPGYGLSGDAFHMTQPAPGGRGSAQALAQCLRNSKLNPEDIDYINAHGTSTPFNDKLETNAIKTVLGDHAAKTPISSTKSMTGHLIGAAGAVEAILSVLTVRDGVLPPTIHYTTPDPECDLDYVPNEARERKVRAAVSNNLGFGGHNASIAFTAFE